MNLAVLLFAALFAQDVNPEEIARKVRPSLVIVEYTLRFDRGEEPRGGGWGQACPTCGSWHGAQIEGLVQQERPLEVVGFALSDRTVLSADPMLHPRFIEKIAVRDGDSVLSTKVTSTSNDQTSVILEVNGKLNATPVSFDAAREGPYYAVTYQRKDGSWTLRVTKLSKNIALTNEGGRYMTVPPFSVIVDAAGEGVGAAMKDRLDPDAWKGSPAEWPGLSNSKMEDQLDRLEEVAGSGLVRVDLGFRSPKKNVSPHGYPGYGEEQATERHEAGILLGEKTVLVLVELKPKVTARLERIRIIQRDGEPVNAKFTHTLKDYGAFLAELEKPIKGALTVSKKDVRTLRGDLLMAADVVFQGEQRKEYFQHDRIIASTLGWRRQLYPRVSAGNVFLFDPDTFDLVVAPVARRQKVSTEERWSGSYALMTPMRYLSEIVANPGDAADGNNIPLTEEEENRLAWMGVLLQPMDTELARANNVSNETNDGQTGALVTYVYPGSPAEKAGVEAGMILLRLHAEDQPKPLEVTIDRYLFEAGFPWHRLEEVPEEAFDRIPQPWPTAENQFTRSLTDLGFGMKYRAEFVVDGERVMKEFVVTASPKHFTSAPKFKSEELGLGVCDMTFEVRRYFQKTDKDPGVIVNKIEPGSKASVAGIKPYERVTHVNDEPVHSAKEFEALIKKHKELRLSVKRMTEGRLVRVEWGAEDKKEQEKKD